ncbi:MAG: ArsR/SmtB family transcription factor [Candidatus Helarchaeota archaeon]
MSEIELQEQIRRFQALSNPTRLKILQLCRRKRCFIREIARELGHTEANISAQVKRLERVGMLDVELEAATHGIRKYVRTSELGQFLLGAGLSES